MVRLGHGCGFDGGGTVAVKPLSPPLPTVCEGVDVLFARTQKIQKIHAHIFAGLADAQQNQVVAETFFRSNSADDAPERSKGFDGMLRVVVVPWHAIKTEKREQFVSVLLQAILELHGYFALHARVDLSIEPIHGDQVFPQITAFQTVAIHSFHHGLEQAGERQREPFKLLVVRVV